MLLSAGPLVARTGLCSQYEVTALHSLGQGPWGLHRQAQGLSLPLQLQVGTVMSQHLNTSGILFSGCLSVQSSNS